MKWLTKESEIETADEESLRNSLITSDGTGTVFKSKVLEQLLKIAKREEAQYWQKMKVYDILDEN